MVLGARRAIIFSLGRERFGLVREFWSFARPIFGGPTRFEARQVGRSDQRNIGCTPSGEAGLTWLGGRAQRDGRVARADIIDGREKSIWLTLGGSL